VTRKNLHPLPAETLQWEWSANRKTQHNEGELNWQQKEKKNELTQQMQEKGS